MSVRRPGLRAVAGALLTAVLGLALPGRAAAQDALACGVPVSGELAAGTVRSYVFATAPGAVVLLQSSATAGAIGLVRIRATGPGGAELIDTCQGVAQFTAVPGQMRVEVSACNGTGTGTYTLTAQVVSDGAGNCGRPLECGATPDGVGFAVAGEVDTFLLSLVEDAEATLRFNYTDAAGAPWVRLYDPDGEEVVLEGGCSGKLTIEAEKTGIYTAVASACSRPLREPYRLEFHDDICAEGPVVTHFGVANAANQPQTPIGFDERGRPVFSQAFGQGFSLVVEGRAGANRNKPGIYAVPYFVDGEQRRADMEMIVSRPLGDGSPVVCDTATPELGGVPATDPFVFQSSDTALAIIEDLGCRFFDGAGELVARQSSQDACTRSDDAFGFGFVDRGSNLQFCGAIASAWDFPQGDTTVAVRMKDARSQEFGSPRELIVRVGNPTPATATPTATRTATRQPTATVTPSRTRTPSPSPTRTEPTLLVTPTETRTRTPSRTPTPSATATDAVTGLPSATATMTPIVQASATATASASATATTVPAACGGDCNGDAQVAINELTTVIGVVLGSVPVEQCPPADAQGDGALNVLDVVAAVNHSLDGCP